MTGTAGRTQVDASIAVRAAIWSSVLSCGGSIAPQPATSNGQTMVSFVVALAFPADRPEGLTWPHESLPPAPYERLVLVVDAMPRISSRGAQDGPALVAARELKIGGRPPEPAGSLTRGVLGLPGPPDRHFLVRLRDGRLRLSLAASDGQIAAKGQVQVRLYEVNPRIGGIPR
jgi:hypothetical protein